MDILEYSILGWIIKNDIVNEKGEKLDFHDRPFLLDILTDWNNQIVIKKCAQIGGSVTFNLKVLYALKMFKWNCIYTFPTDTDVKEFVSSKTNKLIAANKRAFGNLSTDNIERKEYEDRFLFFKGTISKTAAIMTSSDLNVHDEADRSDQKALETYKSRLKASKYKGRWIFSNPTTEKGEIDLYWQKSDKKEWVVKCRHCGLEDYLRFPESIDMKTEKYICHKCKGEITNEDRRLGKWKAQAESEISGYHTSLMMCCWISAHEIIEDSKGDQEYFHNFVLGEPYNPGDLRVSKSMILDNWTPKNITTDNYFLGVDVGNIKHYCLGSEKGIIKVGKFSKWEDLDDILKMYKPITVIDAMPDNTMSKHFKDNYQNVFICYLNRDRDQNRMLRWGEGEEYGVVHTDRNRVIDTVINDILLAKILYAVASDFDFREYLEHWDTLRRIKEVNNLGIERYVWESTNGTDHYVFATIFYWIALQAFGNGAVIPDAINNNIPLVKSNMHSQELNLKEILDNMDYYE